jgi:hypothetical protein
MLNKRGGGQYKTRKVQQPSTDVGRVSELPPSGWPIAWETDEGPPGKSRWRATKMDYHPHPRFSPATPWMLVRRVGEEQCVVGFFEKQDPPFQVAAALDGLRCMPIEYARVVDEIWPSQWSTDG